VLPIALLLTLTLGLIEPIARTAPADSCLWTLALHRTEAISDPAEEPQTRRQHAAPALSLRQHEHGRSAQGPRAHRRGEGDLPPPQRA